MTGETGFTLYEMTDTMRRIADLLEGELPLEEQNKDALEQALVQIKAEAGEKLESIGKLWKSLRAEADMFEAEGKKFADLCGQRRRKASFLLDYAHREMQAQGRDKAGILVKLTVKKNPPSCLIADGINLGNVPRTMLTFIPAIQYVDKSAVIKAWRDGEKLPLGVTVENTRTRLEIK